MRNSKKKTRMNTDEKKIETQKNLAKTIQYNGRIRDKKKDSRMATLMYQAYMSWKPRVQFVAKDIERSKSMNNKKEAPE